MSQMSAREFTSFDQIANALKSRRRRQLLVSLLEERSAEVEAVVGTLSDVMDSKEVRMHLYHTDFPQLEDSAFIDWKRERGVIARGPAFGEIQPLLEFLVNHPDDLPDDCL